MSENQLFYLLQMAGGTFPTGGFSQSWGLETYVSEGSVFDEESFEEFVTTYLERVIGCLEGPAFCHGYELSKHGKTEELESFEEILLAMKLTKETREASMRMGKALLRVSSAMLQNESLTEYYQKNQELGVSYPIAFAVISHKCGIEKKLALEALIYSSVSAVIQSGIKLIPLGNVQAQSLIIRLYEKMRKCVEQAQEIDPEGITNFCPGLDVASMRHENLFTRLYMS